MFCGRVLQKGHSLRSLRLPISSGPFDEVLDVYGSGLESAERYNETHACNDFR